MLTRKDERKMQLHWSGGIQKVMEFLYFISVFQTTEITISRTDQQFWLHLLVPNPFTCMIFYPPVLWYTQLTTANTFVYNFCPALTWFFSKNTPLTKYGRLALLHEKLGKWNYILKFVLYCDGIDYEEQVEIHKK